VAWQGSQTAAHLGFPEKKYFAETKWQKKMANKTFISPKQES
jgi:hypothetical protein